MRSGRSMTDVSLAIALALPALSARADTYPRQPGVDVARYSFRLTLSDATDVIEGEATVDFRVLQDGLETLTLDLVQPRPPAVAKGMTVGAVSEGGRPAAFEHVNSNLLPETTQGAFSFQGNDGSTAFQNFLQGNAAGTCGESCWYAETDIDVVNRFRSGRYELFAQETWRILRNVTLDLGLRYAFYPPLTDADDKLFAFSLV